MSIIDPHGGYLVNKENTTIKNDPNFKDLIREYKTVIVDDRFLSDCEMIAVGAYSPLTGFMNEAEVNSVLDNMQLLNGEIWSVPIILPIDAIPSKKLALSDKFGNIVALMNVSETFSIDKRKFCEKLYGTSDINHPGVRRVLKYPDTIVAGDITLINRPSKTKGVDSKYFLDPKDTRALLKEKGFNNVVAFQTRNPIHRAHEYLIKCAMETVDAVLIHPLVGETKSDDIPADVRMQCYEVLRENYFNKDRCLLSVLPAPMHYAGPREAIHHMIMRKNYGCSHMIIGRDHAGVGDYYGTYDAQELADSVNIGIKTLKFEHTYYCKDCEHVASKKTCPHDSSSHVHLSGTKVRSMLASAEMPPKEFSREKVANILMKWALGKKQEENQKNNMNQARFI